MKVESNLCLLEDTITAGKEAKEITNGSSGFIVNILKENLIYGEWMREWRMNERMKNGRESKDAIIGGPGYMIPVGRDEILSRLAGISAVF